MASAIVTHKGGCLHKWRRRFPFPELLKMFLQIGLFPVPTVQSPLGTHAHRQRKECNRTTNSLMGITFVHSLWPDFFVAGILELFHALCLT